MEGSRKPLAKVEGRRRLRLSGVTVAWRGTPNLDDWVAYIVNGTRSKKLILAGMVREDQFLRPSAVDDVCHPIVEVRRSAPRDGDAAQPQAPPAFYFCERFPTAFHRRVDLRLRCAGRSDRRTAGRAPIIARQPYECRDFSVKASFVREKCPCATSTRLRAAWNRRIFGAALSVDQWIVIFRDAGRERASNRAISSTVDSCGHVDKLCAFFIRSARA